MKATNEQTKRWNQAKADHKSACDGTLTKAEFFSQPEADQIEFAKWLRKQARDIN